MKSILCLTLPLFILLQSCQKKADRQQLASVGSRIITIDEFRDRANFTPVLGNISNQQHKDNILSSIVAEALLSQMRIDTLPEYLPLIIEQKNREAIIEKLWDDVILKDIEVSDSALWDFYVNTTKQRVIEFAVFNDSGSAENFANAWKNDNPAVKKVLSKDTLSFKGEIALLEKEVFHAEKDSISLPLLLGKKYLVFKVLREWQIAPISTQEFNERYTSFKKSYIKTLKHEYFIAYARKTFKKENYQLNKDLFKELTMALESKVLDKPVPKEVNTDMLHYSFPISGPDLSATIVHFDNGSDLTVRDFLKRLAVSPYPLDYSSKGAFRYSLIKASRRMLDDELLYRKGLQYNLNKTDYVTWQTAMWRDFYQSREVLAKIKNSGLRKDHVLDSLKQSSAIEVRWAVFDTLQISRTDMIVLKSHFPGQTIVPRQSFWNFKLDRNE